VLLYSRGKAAGRVVERALLAAVLATAPNQFAAEEARANSKWMSDECAVINTALWP
jgi:hypothetical protein